MLLSLLRVHTADSLLTVWEITSILTSLAAAINF